MLRVMVKLNGNHLLARDPTSSAGYIRGMGIISSQQYHDFVYLVLLRVLTCSFLPRPGCTKSGFDVHVSVPYDLLPCEEISCATMLTRSLSDTRGLFGTVYSSSPESKINVTVFFRFIFILTLERMNSLCALSDRFSFIPRCIPLGPLQTSFLPTVRALRQRHLSISSPTTTTSAYVYCQFSLPMHYSRR
ncbi:hypothetical protein L208DRAFT_1410644 [Tricholoma matsutake]|nr:hypothetical protein L208DRAFT_1410644 [Tricholoma matsutake 945]